MANRVLVLPKIPTKGLYLLTAAAGLVHGLVHSWIMVTLFGMLERTVYSSGFILPALVFASLYCTPAFLFALLVARIHPQFWRVLLAGVCYAAAVIAGIVVMILWYNPGALLTPWTASNPLMIMGAAMGIGVYAVVLCVMISSVFCLGYLWQRYLGRRVIIQSGLICWACGYNLGSPTITICPECGGPFDPNQPPRIASSGCWPDSSGMRPNSSCLGAWERSPCWDTGS